MFPTIDAGIGMAFVYLLLSLVCSAIREAGEGLAMKRSAALKAGLHRLLGQETALALCKHPLVAGLADHPSGPDYIPPRAFSSALLDLMGDNTQISDHLRQALRALEAGAQREGRCFQEAIEAWFNSAMESVSGAYKRHTHVWLAVIGLGVTIAMNADSIRMISALLDNTELRTKTAQAGEQHVSAPLLGGQQASSELRSFGMPIGWCGVTRDNTLPWKEPWTGPWWKNARLLLQWHWAGWLFTVAAISLGAPFWFDLLKRVAPIRGPGRRQPEN
jgi:hypothetical protein